MSIEEIGDLAKAVIDLAMQSGLTWDESIAAFGIATKAIAVTAALSDQTTIDESIAHATKRFQQGMQQDARMVDISTRH